MAYRSALMRSARFNGNPYFPTNIPDLIGVGERRYIDQTAAHRLRNAGIWCDTGFGGVLR